MISLLVVCASRDEGCRLVARLTAAGLTGGTRVHLATAAEAFPLMRHGRFDALLVTGVPLYRDGVELVRRIRSTCAFKDLPVMAFLTDERLDDRIRMHFMGASSVVTMSSDPAMLMEVFRFNGLSTSPAPQAAVT